MRESLKVEERLVPICTEDDLNTELAKAGSKLVVLEIQSQSVCQTGWEEEPELQWKADQRAALEPCRQLKHSFLRTARDCSDVVFLELDADDEDGQELCDKLGVEVLPTLQFYKEGKKIWEHRGHQAMEPAMGEGVLYFGDAAGGGEKASTYVTELHSRADFDHFMNQQDDKVLKVVNISLSSASPCVRIFPAVLALARNFQGYAAFARLMGDENEELQQVMADYNIVQVPTFLFFRNGKETGRHVGSSRGDLIGQILQQQSALGIPPPPPQGGVPRKPASAAPRPRRSHW
ncbi:hypothetical protein N2152v2_007626 [Parachlorella kessleri]